jgi:hypothetical protein
VAIMIGFAGTPLSLIPRTGLSFRYPLSQAICSIADRAVRVCRIVVWLAPPSFSTTVSRRWIVSRETSATRCLPMYGMTCRVKCLA